MKSADSSPTVTRYVAGVALAGVIAVGAAFAIWPPSRMVGWLPVAYVAAGAAIVWAPLRFRFRGQVQGFIFDEVILIGLLFAAPTGYVPLLLSVSMALGHVLRRAEWLKIAYNGGQHAVSSVVAAGVFRLVGAVPDVLSWPSIAAAVAGGLAYNWANSGLFSGLMVRLAGRTYRDALLDVWRVNVVTWIGNISTGLLIAYLASIEPVGTLLAVAPLVGMYLGFRGYAAIVEERSRSEQLHDITASLAKALGDEDVTRDFLRQLQELLGGEWSELLLYEHGQPRLLRLQDDEWQERVQPADHSPLFEAIRRGTGVVISGEDQELKSGHDYRDAVAAPVVYEGRTLGAIAVYDRHGIEAWEDDDARVLALIGSEAGISLKNVELFESIADERRRLAEESRKLRDIVSTASDGIVLIDAGRRVETWNPAMEQITGMPAEEAQHQPWHMALRFRRAGGQEVAGRLFEPLEDALSGRQSADPVDLQLLHQDGEWRWVRCTFSPIVRDGEDCPTGVVLVARDITREHETEELKTDFIATVSHELRTPLTPLKGFVMTLLNAGERFPEDRRESTYEAMLRQVERLESLVADLLVVADIDRGFSTLRTGGVELCEAVQDVVATERPVSEPDRIDVYADKPVHVIGDRAAVERVVRAVVSNAVKHTAGRVIVRVRTQRGEGLVEVIDEGPGIVPSHQERIFERFGRLGNHLTRSTQGPGLGLSIARSLAERLGGRLNLESEVGQGTTFTFGLPLTTLRQPDERSSAPR